ncbi:hypothetical protein [Wenxinia marina]|uniref:Uncharacterized protein n=1 Tax=Wenxinia marina DSM 24838 TaxID=1123501 RepID=A0A0D0P845_9RHOB|nr:hypothetical protein [Wenxinia marina]KIQ67721.1 hypothetical protein Wenmar_03680 [Wenxinia marina DSM 24838]GGL77699.1 hypothetical protein GCM10011392_35260 [Wenxinia marina]
MQTLAENSKGLTLLMRLNWDRFVALAVLFGSLAFSAWVGG